MPLHLIHSTKTTPADTERWADTREPARYGNCQVFLNSSHHESAVTAAIAMERSRAASAQPEPRCPNANDEPCAYPQCRCHEPQLAHAEELQAEPPTLWERIKRWLTPAGWFWTAYAAGIVSALLLGTIGREMRGFF